MRVAATLALMIMTGTAVGTTNAVLAQEAETFDAKAALGEAASLLGDNPTQDAVVRALDLLAAAADEGDVVAMKRLAEIHAAGKYGVEADIATAVGYYDRAVEANDNAARRSLAGILLAGNGVPADPMRAVELLQAAVDAGDATAPVTLARLYTQGRDGVPHDGAKALALLEPLAEDGTAGPLVALGNLFRTGAPGVEADPAKAVAYYQQATDLDNNTARRSLASLLIDDDAGVEDADRALALLTASGESGDASAFSSIALIYAGGLGGAAVDGAKAVDAYQRAIDADYTPAYLSLARLLTDGKLVPADPERAASLLETAIAEGDSKAILPLAKLYSTGQGGMAIDGQRAVDLLQPLAENGDTAALSALGDIYTSGAGDISADADMAFSYYSQASDLGVNAAAKKVATLLATGNGTSANLEAAVSLLEPLGEGGDAGAYLTLGDMFSRGEVTTPDIERARGYYELAGEAGDVRGIMRLAALMSTGALGVSPDGRAAVAYYEQAIAAGDANARRGLASLLYAGRVVRRDVPAAVALLKDAMADGDAAAAMTLGRMYSQGGAIRADYDEAKNAFEQAIALGGRTALLNYANALMGPQLGARHGAEGQALLVSAVEQDVPGARSTLARLQATGKISGAGVADAITTLESGVETGDMSSIRYLLQIYRDGVPRTVRANPAKAAALLEQVSGTLPPSIAALETALLAVKTSPSLATYASISEQLGRLDRGDALSLIRRLRTLDANAYVYVVQDYLTRRGYYSGALNGLLTNATIRAFNAACADANTSASCDRGPLSSDAGNVISQLMLLPESPEDTDGDIALLAPTLPGSYPVALAAVSGDWAGRWSYVTTL